MTIFLLKMVKLLAQPFKLLCLCTVRGAQHKCVLTKLTRFAQKMALWQKPNRKNR